MNARIPLVIRCSGAGFSPFIGAVDSVMDLGHCLVKVDAADLEKTREDPSGGDRAHKAGEYLTSGAFVSATEVAS